MNNIFVDLHMHSTDSDATIELDDLLCELLEKDIKVFSITEHETMVNVNKAQAFANDNNLSFIPGVELTVDLKGRKHILGYGVNANDNKLKKVMAHNEPLLLAEMEDQPHLFSSVEETIDAIKSAGGVPVLAHPGAEFYGVDYKDTIKSFLDLGVEGIECYHPQNNEEVTNYCLKVCREKDLLITGGSDYHGDCVPSRKLGMMGIQLKDLNLKHLL